MSVTVSERDLVNLVYREAQLLDAGRFEDWLALFAEDGRYWMPLVPGQTERRLHTSLLDEDLLLLKIRVARLRNARTYSQQPPSRCHHLLQQPRVEARDDSAGTYRLHTAFHYLEYRRDEQTLFAGWATHDLVAVDGTLRIRLKRVDLLNCDAAHRNIQLLV
jgi:3-phenylpropionate/cinnamic acid dioxygenase small subunit